MGPVPIKRFLGIKLWALRALLVTNGWTPDEEPPVELVAAYLFVLRSPGAHWFRRACAGLALDYYVPGWRDVVDPKTLGPACERNDPQVTQLRNAVLERDGYECTVCGATEGLHAHHMTRWVDDPSLRLVEENGVTLCKACHGRVHGKVL